MSTPVWESVLAPNLGPRFHEFYLFLSCLRFGAPNFGQVLGPILGAEIGPQMELAASAAFHVEHRSCSENTHALRSAKKPSITNSRG